MAVFRLALLAASLSPRLVAEKTVPAKAPRTIEMSHTDPGLAPSEVRLARARPGTSASRARPTEPA